MAAVRLDLLGDEHLQLLAILLQDPAVQRFTRIPVPVPAGYERTWLDRYEEGRRTRTREMFAIVDGDEGVGVAVAVGIDAEARTAELGYVVAPQARGRGVATEALR